MKTLFFCFNGTGVRAGSPTVMMPSLMNTISALAVQNDNQFKTCADGNCSTSNNNNFFGAAYDTASARGLQEQVDSYTKMVREVIEENKGEKVRLVLAGFSRGAVAALKVALDLKDVPKNQLKIYISAVDPVPGESSTHANVLDSWTAAVKDLSQCQNLAGVQLLYASQQPSPMPMAQSSNGWSLLNNVGNFVANTYAGACFKAVKPKLPRNLEKCDIGAGPGEHVVMQAMAYKDYQIKAHNDQSLITFHRVMRFLMQAGVAFKPEQLSLHPSLNLGDTTELQAALNRENQQIESHSTYDLHSSQKVQVRANKQYLNSFHQKICDQPIDLTQCSLIAPGEQQALAPQQSTEVNSNYTNSHNNNSSSYVNSNTWPEVSSILSYAESTYSSSSSSQQQFNNGLQQVQQGIGALLSAASQMYTRNSQASTNTSTSSYDTSSTSSLDSNDPIPGSTYRKYFGS